MSLLLLVLLAAPASAAAVVEGGHSESTGATVPAATDSRRATLEELWQRRILPPEQKMWNPDDFALLERIRRAEGDALEFLKRKAGGYRPWTAKARAGALAGVPRLTKEGFERYLFLVTQEAIEYFESKGADAKWVFQLRDMDGRLLFDGRGTLTEAGAAVYRLGRANAEVFWKGPDGSVFGTRRPPKGP